ncbi:MAG: DUF3365 domain-containing protein [Planctomycetaceae bacterium]|nr:DUF3365 domain-containing protein [Planctomycetaceae bacterium]
MIKNMLVLMIAASSFAWAIPNHQSVSVTGTNQPGQEAGETSDSAAATLEIPRRQAEVLHSAMHSALRVVHDRYYKEDEGLTIPAAALEEVFQDVQNEHRVQFRWLVVEGQAMNVDHSAKTDFEKDAVKALKEGKPFLETTEDNMYRRAGPITLTNHCLKCHLPDRKSTKNRTAGLIISVPLSTERK